jgi:hypothetical protein
MEADLQRAFSNRVREIGLPFFDPRDAFYLDLELKGGQQSERAQAGF